MACDHPSSSWSHSRSLMGFKSGDWAGHDKVLIWWSSIHTLIDLTVSHGTLSYWKKQSSELVNIVRAEGSKFSSRTTLYVAWFMRPSQTNFTVGARHCFVGLSRSPSNDEVLGKAENWTPRRRWPYSSPLLWSFGSLALQLSCICHSFCRLTALFRGRMTDFYLVNSGIRSWNLLVTSPTL
jgi:hypothetical protein